MKTYLTFYDDETSSNVFIEENDSMFQVGEEYPNGRNDRYCELFETFEEAKEWAIENLR